MTAGWKLFTHWEIRLSLAYHVAGAVDYMHCRGLIHRDLTSANLLVGANWQAKVRDQVVPLTSAGEVPEPMCHTCVSACSFTGWWRRQGLGMLP